MKYLSGFECVIICSASKGDALDMHISNATSVLLLDGEVGSARAFEINKSSLDSLALSSSSQIIYGLFLYMGFFFFF